MHTSTSPQYSMIASLDVARKQAVMEGYKLLARTLALAQGAAPADQFDRRVPRARAGGPAARGGARTTASASTRPRSRSTSPAAATPWTSCRSELFERYNIQVEKSTFNTLTLLLTIGTTRSQGLAPVRRADAHRARGPRAAAARIARPKFPRFTQLRYLPRDAYYCGGELRAGARRAGARQPRARRPRLPPTRSCPTRPASRCWCRAR